MNWERPRCPECGEEARGTLEKVEGIAIVVPDGEGGFQYGGYTDMFWNSQQTVQENGEDVLVCSNRHEWTTKRVA